MNTNFIYHIKDVIKFPSNKRGGFETRQSREDGVCLEGDCFVAPLLASPIYVWRAMTNTDESEQSLSPNGILDPPAGGLRMTVFPWQSSGSCLITHIEGVILSEAKNLVHRRMLPLPVRARQSRSFENESGVDRSGEPVKK